MNLRKPLVVFLLALAFTCPYPLLAEVKKKYYPSGKLMAESIYEDGKLDGIAKLYYESGQLEAEFIVINGMFEGVGKFYFENGTLKK